MSHVHDISIYCRLCRKTNRPLIEMNDDHKCFLNIFELYENRLCDLCVDKINTVTLVQNSKLVKKTPT